MPKLQLWLRSTLFEVEEGEDDQTNPLCFGRQLAHWLRERLIDHGRAVEEPIAEDWGWCLVVRRKPGMLWVGCANIHDHSRWPAGGPLPPGHEICWSCFVVAEQTLLGRSTSGSSTEPAHVELFELVTHVVKAGPANTLVEEPG